MKFRIFPILSFIIVAVCLSFLGFRLFKWYEDHQKRKELFVYLQTRSPVVKRLPADARVYINFYDFKRVYEELEDTRFYEVLAHWFDTGMSDSSQGSNALLGGMIEKTALDTLGNEFGVAFVPSALHGLDFVAIAKPESGSSFILKLALASAKKTRRIDFNGSPIYAFPTKDSRYPEIFVYLADDLVFASSDIERIKTAASKEGTGPEFLKKIATDAVPPNTFLFAQSDSPALSAIGFGAGHEYRLRVEGNASIASHLPDIKENDQTVFQLQTNGPEILNQPATSFSLESDAGDPVSHLLLTFAKAGIAKQYSETLLQQLNPDGAAEMETFNRRGFECFHYQKSKKERYVCSSEAAVLLAGGRLDLENAGFKLKGIKSETLPLIVRLQFSKAPIADFFHRVETKEWSRFNQAKSFYFLSCIEDFSGSIDRSGREISVRLH